LVLLEQTSTEARRLLAFQNDSLALLISGLRKQIWLARRNTAWVLHGPIQSALTSAAMALGSNSEQLRERKAIRDTIADALEALESKSPTQPRLEDALTDITRVWERSCKVEVELDSVADLLLQEDIDSAFCVIEIVREAVSNAVRHGRATRISARIALTQDQLIQVTVENNGVACPELQDIGLGSAMLDQITHQWTRENLPNGVRLSAFVVPESHE
jgi:nitrate/nitrite-specific signal transduction histidine kinase